MEPKEQAAQLPEKRGVYMFKDAVDQVIYVGKVRSRRNRDKNPQSKVKPSVFT
jgi:excinuclease UvrABC nuclease subunit